MLQSFVLQGAFFNLLHSVDIVVAAADDADDGFAFDCFGIIVQGCDAKGAGRFDDDGVFIVQFEDGGAYFSFGHEVHIVQHFAADAEGEGSYSFHCVAVHEAFDAVQGHRGPALQGCRHGGGSFGFEADDLCRGGFHLEIAACSGSEAATSDRGEQVIDLGQVFQDLHGYGALSFDDPEIVKRRDKGHCMFFGELPGCYGAVIKGGAGEDDLDKIFPEHFGLVDFLFWGDDGHEYHSFDSQFAAGVGEALGTVAGAGAYAALLQFVSREGHHHIVSSSQFIRADYLQVFPFQKDAASVFAGEVVIKSEGCPVDHFVQSFRGLMNIQAQVPQKDGAVGRASL